MFLKEKMNYHVYIIFVMYDHVTNNLINNNKSIGDMSMYELS